VRGAEAPDRREQRRTIVYLFVAIVVLGTIATPGLVPSL
jgi:hypothetical protein